MRFRYPGPDSFSDVPFDTRMFFGRREEEIELSNKVAGVRLIILYGKSGLGKTSLLQAGLFPHLRRMGYFPLRVRPAELGENLVESVFDAMLDVCKRYHYQVTTTSSPSLLELFNNTAITRGERFQTPVLVLDQFEEVFHLMSRAERDTLFREIQHLLFPPSSADSAPDVRVVLSLREEFVGALDELTSILPGVLNQRFRISPLSRAKAADAIAKPAAIEESNDVTPNFCFRPEAVEEMLDYLQDQNQDVEPIELQILCQHVERVVQRQVSKGKVARDVTIAEYFPSGMQAALEDYYLDVVNDYSGRTRRRVRKFCEQGLVTQDGYRDSIRERRVRSLYGLEDDVLNELVDKRLLRREDRLNDVWYELTHDRIAEAVAANRPESQLSRLVRSGRWIGDALIAATLCVLVFATLRIMLQAQAEPLFEVSARIGRQSVVDVEVLRATLAAPTALRDMLPEEVAAGLIGTAGNENTIRMTDLFPSGSAAVREDRIPLLRTIGEALAAQLAATRGTVLIGAHTDNVPMRSLRFLSNWELSEERARAVGAIIAESVDPRSIITEGFADSQPLAPNDSTANRAVNRRIEITLQLSGSGGESW